MRTALALSITLLLACSSSSDRRAPDPEAPEAPPEAAPETAPGPAESGLEPVEKGQYAAAMPEPITFASGDGLEITADLYPAHGDPATPFVVLFHQAGWSRGAYREIAPRLNELGFNAMAVDLRAGGEVNGVENETHRRAEEQGLGTTYVDALPDMRAALAHARKKYAEGPVIGWGSSYSAALILRIAGDSPGLVDAVLAFSPGEYFAELGKPDTWIHDAADHIEAPVFITSAREEKDAWWSIYRAVSAAPRSAFVPETEGNHGSRALWSKFDDSGAYWGAVEAFFEQLEQAGVI